MQSDLAEIISETKLKVNAIMKKLETVGRENRELKIKLSAFEDRNKVMDRELNEKDKNIKMLKLARNVAGGNTDTQGVKRQINELVNEIDRCMALLNE